MKGDRGRKKSDVDTHVGRRVRLRRLELGMSQERLGELLGLSFQQVQKYERGTNRIGAGRLYEVARILGVGIDYFYVGVDKIPFQQTGTGKEEHNKIGEFVTSSEGLLLCRAFMRIKDAATRKRIVDLLTSLSDA